MEMIMPMHYRLLLREQRRETPAQAYAVTLCVLCGEPSDGSYYPCGHSLENVRKCC